MELTEAQIKDRLDRWFGLRYASYPQSMLDGIRLFVSLPADDREKATNALNAFFCIHCGGDNPDCQCWNDE